MKASKYLRECREITTSCCSKLIRAQAALNQALLAIQEKPDKLTEKDANELDTELEKMQTTLDSLIKSTQELELKWLRGTGLLKCRPDRGRKANPDSGFLSTGSAMMQPEDKEPFSKVAQPTKEPEDKQCSDSFQIDISLPEARRALTPSIEITDTTTDDIKCDKNAKEEDSSSRLPTEHADTDSLLNRDHHLCVHSENLLTMNNLPRCDLASGTDSSDNEANADNNELNSTDQVNDGTNTAAQQIEAISSEEAHANLPVHTSAAVSTGHGQKKDCQQKEGNNPKWRFKKPKGKSNTF